MKNLILLSTCLLTASAATFAEEKPPAAAPEKILYENKFDAAPGAPWKIAKGKWELVDGVWRASELAADSHPGVARLPNTLTDFVIEYEFKFEEAKVTTLSINGPKGHMARVVITPKQVTFQKDDSDHEGPDKAVVFAKLPANFTSGTWHKVRLEMIGDSLRGQVDDLKGEGKHESFKQERTAGLTVGGEAVEFRNFKITRAAAPAR